ncbi:MAG: DegT/DnrJ/EryC1/StrS family aminotransferase [Deltaproteobacteria bacterium]|nr:DegT/DnrJ/EryC1/StrS family aminotransferase [Deltaproteobacteria bacterium]
MPGYELIGQEELDEIQKALSKKILLRYEHKENSKVLEFERKFAQYCKAGYALAVSSGTAALRVALAALGVGPGDEVITQGFTFIATWEAILDAGAIPVFAEIDNTLCLDPNDLEKKITPRTKAIIPVHMCGSHANIEEIMKVADRHGIPVLEDTAQSTGGWCNGRALGSFGSFGTFSFDAVKTITTGEGGIILTNDKTLYTKASEYSDHGHDHNPNVSRGLEKRSFIGFNFRMMELQGALGVAQLGRLDNILKIQRENKARLKEALSKFKDITFRHIPDPSGDTATFMMFLLPDEKQAREFNRIMASEGHGAVYWYDNDWHYYERWEHLLEGKSLVRTGYPFKTPEGETRCSYDKNALPATAAIMSRALTIQITLNMEEKMPGLLKAIEKAGRGI